MSMSTFKRTIKMIEFFVSVVILALVAIIVVQRFSNNKASIAGIRIFTVVTQSMEPEYSVGDVLLVKYKDPNKIMVGEDVAYQGEVDDYAGKVITHRVKSIKADETGERTFVTQGIANENADPEIKGSQIYGTVVGKMYVMSFLNKIINNSYGMYFLIIIPLAVIIFTEYKGFKQDREEIRREEKEEYEDDYYDEYNDNYKYRRKDDNYEEDDYKDDEFKSYSEKVDNRGYYEYDEEDYYMDRKTRKRKERRAKRRRKYEQ